MNLGAVLERLGTPGGEPAVGRGLVGRWHVALDGVEPLVVDARSRDGVQQALRVRMFGVCEQLFDRCLLDELAGVHHVDAVADLRDDAHVVGDKEDRQVTLGLDVLEEFDDLGLNRHVEGGRGFVADEHVGVAREHHRDHCALSHPPGELVGVLVESPLGVGDRDVFEQVDGDVRGLLAGDPAVDPEGLPDLVAHRVDGVQGFQRVLEDHADAAPADLLVLVGAELRELGTVEDDRGLREDFARRVDQPHDRPRSDAFPGAGFADDPERFAGRNRQRDPVNGADVFVVRPEDRL